MGYPADVDLMRCGRYHVDLARTVEGEIDGVITELEPRSLAHGLTVAAITD